MMCIYIYILAWARALNARWNYETEHTRTYHIEFESTRSRTTGTWGCTNTAMNLLRTTFLSQGPGNAELEFGISQLNVQIELRKPLNEYFQTMQDSIRLGTCLRIASDATQSNFLGLAWLGKYPKLVLDAIFEEQVNKKYKKKMHGTGPEDEKAGTEPYPRGSKNMQNA